MKRVPGAVIVLLPVIFAALGYASGPVLARKHYVVALADSEPWLAAEQASNERQAFLAEGRLERPPLSDAEAGERLLDRARAVVAGFRLGGALFGAWCGLVAALKIASLGRVPRRTEYEIDHAVCVACGRCFRYCPRERLRLKKRAGGADTG